MTKIFQRNEDGSVKVFSVTELVNEGISEERLFRANRIGKAFYTKGDQRVYVSTVLLAMCPDLTYETLVETGSGEDDHDFDTWRFATEEEARKHFAETCAEYEAKGFVKDEKAAEEVW